MFEFIPNAVERISKGTKAVADPGGGSGGLGLGLRLGVGLALP